MTDAECSTSSFPLLAPTNRLEANYMNRLQRLAYEDTEQPIHVKMNQLEVLPSAMAAFCHKESDADQNSMESQLGETRRSSQDQENPLRPAFDATRCLFCHTLSHDFESNVLHMSKSHGFMVPEQHRLRVDLETFYDYLDLIISGYAQCIYCGTERSNVWAARNHMRGKNHCKIDIAHQDSEFREFYDWDSDGDDTTFVRVDETTLRLPSGRLLSDRSVRLKHHGGRRSPTTTSASPELTNGSHDAGTVSQRAGSILNQSLASLRTNEKRDVAFFNQLTQLRQTDRASLAHLPTSQQRAQLMVVKKQTDIANKTQQSSEGRLGGKTNRTSITYFVPNLPGKKSGAHYAKIWTP